MDETKLQIKLSVTHGYKTVYMEIVTAVIDKLKGYQDIQEALFSCRDNERMRQLLDTSKDHSIEIFCKSKEALSFNKGVASEQDRNKEGGPMWKLRASLEERTAENNLLKSQLDIALKAISRVTLE